jgi:hypothetical protein
MGETVNGRRRTCYLSNSLRLPNSMVRDRGVKTNLWNQENALPLTLPSRRLPR